MFVISQFLMSETQEDLPVWFWLRVSHEAVIRMSAGSSSSEDLDGAEGFPFKQMHSIAVDWQS